MVSTMSRKRLTQIFPFLISLRRAQATFCFYQKMKHDPKYQLHQMSETLPYNHYTLRQNMINAESGFDIKYQYNKAYNLQCYAKPIHRILIEPEKTFSFCYLIKDVSSNNELKEGLNLVDGVIQPSIGGGLCQLSNMIYEAALHTELTISERHPHLIEYIYNPSETIIGLDATIAVGWCDLKLTNNTTHPYQILVTFDGTDIIVQINSTIQNTKQYIITNSNLHYTTTGNHTYQTVDVNRTTLYPNGKQSTTKLYTNKCEIGYSLDLCKEERR